MESLKSMYRKFQLSQRNMQAANLVGLLGKKILLFFTIYSEKIKSGAQTLTENVSSSKSDHKDNTGTAAMIVLHCMLQLLVLQLGAHSHRQH